MLKKLLPVIIIFLVGISCASQKPLGDINPDEVEAVSEDTISMDSIEYSIETFDPKFETWYQLHNNETTYHSLNYYEQWNQEYVSVWNAKANDSNNGGYFDPIVGYNPDTKYGLELNHKLFYYFQYVENVLKIKFMSYSPKTPPF